MDPTNIYNILASNEHVSEITNKDTGEISESETWITGKESLFDSVENLSYITVDLIETVEKDKETADFQDVLAKIRNIRTVIRNVSIVYKITKWDIVTIYIGIFLYSLDITLNLVLAMIYFGFKFIFCGSLTLVILIVPSILFKFTDRIVLWKFVKHKGWYWLWVWPYFLLNVDTIFKYDILLKLTYMYLRNYEIFGMNQQKTALKAYNRFMAVFQKVASSKVIAIKWQTIPLIILHLAIFIYNIRRNDMNLVRRFQLITLIVSSIEIISTNFTNYRSLKYLTCIRINFLGGMLYTLGLSIPIICRCFAISACLSFSIIAGTIIVALHCIAAIYWSYMGGGITDKKFINSILTGIELTMVPLFSAPRRSLITNSILLFENIILLFIWAIPEKSTFSFILPVCILSFDIIFRIVHVYYCKYRNNFTTTVLL